jgi:hypothetical protein
MAYVFDIRFRLTACCAPLPDMGRRSSRQGRVAGLWYQIPDSHFIEVLLFNTVSSTLAFQMLLIIIRCEKTA